MPQTPVISVRNLGVRYGERTIIENINFDITKGDIFVIVGGSGCGKSTLLRQLIGIEIPTEGRIYIEGEDFINADSETRQKIMRKSGVLFQSSGLFASMTLAENIALVLQANTTLSGDRIMEMVELKLASVGLQGYESYLPSEISGGMKKRAALARAMALDPSILFFDEPSSGLDPVTSASLDKLITELNLSLGTTMIVVTHDLSSIFSISHRIIMLDKDEKGIIASGTADELKDFTSNPKVYNFFNRIPENQTVIIK